MKCFICMYFECNLTATGKAMTRNAVDVALINDDDDDDDGAAAGT